MKKKLQKDALYFSFLIFYLIIGNYFHIYLFCPIYKITGLYCPGCGITRMFLSMLKLDFYQAFRYNPLLFLSLPFFLFWYIDSIYSFSKKKDSHIKKLEPYIWYILITIFVLYGILRNIPLFDYLKPTAL